MVEAYASGTAISSWIPMDMLALREVQRTLPSTAFLFPNPKLWAEKDVLVITPEKNYTTVNLKEFFEDIKYPDGYQHYLDVYEDWILNPPGVKVIILGNFFGLGLNLTLQVYCIYGSKLTAPSTLVYKKGQFPDMPPTKTFEEGDGTVNIRSLQVCDNWKTESNSGYEVEIKIG